MTEEQLTGGDISNVAVVIPAYNPGAILLELVEELAKTPFAAIVVVDDGSTSESASVFAQLMTMARVHVLRHAVNAGKGRALKTAFNHCLLLPGLRGVVTADADGQHGVQDILRIALAVQSPQTQKDRALLLGVRQFSGEVPLRSRFGNSLTRNVFRLLYGVELTDTQCGLRGLPQALLPAMLLVEGERYEYESSMLIAAGLAGYPLREIPISTIYLDNNSSSHFNIVRDSMKIYFVLLRFVLSSLLTSVIDFVVFALALLLGLSLPAGMVCGRGIALGFNFLVNQRWVFRQMRSNVATLGKYVALVLLLGVLSYLLIEELQALWGMTALGAKALAETVLFILSFSVQRQLVFTREPHNQID